MLDALVEVVIVGGGPAGMAAALILGRARLSTVVFNDEWPRNWVTQASHGFYTRDGAHPMELLEVAKSQLAPYKAVQYRAEAIASISKEGQVFCVTSASGSVVRARRVILAVGMRDDLAQTGLEGIERVYGRSVFPCPFCDGFELRERALAVFTHGAQDEMVAHYLSMIQTLSSTDLIWFANGRSVGDGLVAELERQGVGVALEVVKCLESDAEGQLTGVVLDSGQVVPRTGGFLGGSYAVANPLVEQLGVPMEVNPMGWSLVQSQEQGQTGLEGVYVAGDVRAGFGKISGAAAQGAVCAAGIVREVAQERWNHG